MIVKLCKANRASYGQSGAGSYQYHYGSGRIGVTENQDCQGAH